jgi:aspartate racemase
MNTIGLLGGMSWESSMLYYQTINRVVRDANPSGDGLSSAPILLDSVNFAVIAKWMLEEDWKQISEYLTQHARVLETAGAQVIGICTNTMHKVYDTIASSVSVPIIHIATPTIAALKAAGVTRAALLGTRFSMNDGFLHDVYATEGIELLTPDNPQCEQIHNIIMNELCQGVILESSRAMYVDAISMLQQQGAQAVVLGCTEISLLLRSDDVELPMFDTADLHARALAAFYLG